jgi:peptidoglycan hydrolase CwlO-like protein
VDFSTIISIAALAASILLAVGAAIVRDRQLTAMIRAGDDALLERIEDVRHDYVRRDDHDKAISRLESSVSDVRHEMKEMHGTVNAVLVGQERMAAQIATTNTLLQAIATTVPQGRRPRAET